MLTNFGLISKTSRVSARDARRSHHAAVAGVDEILGDYHLLEKIAEGGQGVVWKASPCRFPEVVVAIKTMNSPAPYDQAAIYRFREDARAIARMNHPHIIRTTYVGRRVGPMVFCDGTDGRRDGGRTVSQLIKPIRGQPQFSLKRSPRAIHHAHTRNEGVIHLDLKPGNILLNPDGEPKVTDFGLAVAIGSNSAGRRNRRF